jgi:hypothetical protein
LVGLNPPAWLRRRVNGLRQIELHANVADVRPYIHQSSVMAVPLRIGGGSRLKILEALACGLPVVSTTIGAEGLSLESGRHLQIVGEVSAMASALVQVIRDPENALQMALNGRRVILERYDWDALAAKLEAVWLSLGVQGEHGTPFRNPPGFINPRRVPEAGPSSREIPIHRLLPRGAASEQQLMELIDNGRDSWVGKLLQP